MQQAAWFSQGSEICYWGVTSEKGRSFEAGERGEAETRIEQARGEVNTALEQARQSLARQAEELARQAAERMLGRSL